MTDAVITVKQPFASAILLAGKDVENRSWSTDFRGRLWIHAAQRWWTEPIRPEVKRAIGANLLHDHTLPRGGIIGCVDLVDVLAPDDPHYRTRVGRYSSRWATRGMHHWVLANPRPLRRVIPWQGRQSLTYVERDEIREAARRLSPAR